MSSLGIFYEHIWPCKHMVRASPKTLEGTRASEGHWNLTTISSWKEQSLFLKMEAPVVTVGRESFSKKEGAGKTKWQMTITPWPLQQSPAAADSWRTCFIQHQTFGLKSPGGFQFWWATPDFKGATWTSQAQTRASLHGLHPPSFHRCHPIWHRLWSSRVRGFFLPSTEVPWASLRPSVVRDKS